MHDFDLVALGGLALVSLVILKVLGPIASALAKRIAGAPAHPAATDPSLPELRQEVEQLQERVDFLERALVARQRPPELPHPRTPA